MKPDMSKSTAISDISSPNFLTPTTLKNITQILESEECMKSIRTFELTGDADMSITVVEAKETPKASKTTPASNLRTRSGNTYFNLDSKSWQGGITTVGTPTERISSIAEKFEEENRNIEEEQERNSDEENSSQILNGTFLPESVVQTNIRQQKKQQPVQRTMITRSLSNMSNSSDKNSTKAYYPVGNRAGRKASMKGKRNSTRYNPEEEGMSPEERERLHVRRQRNKEAAARCRKRRVDQTNTLQAQVDQWMAKKRAMEEEIGALTREKEELEFILTQHCQSAADGLCAIGGKRRRTMITHMPAQILVRRTNPATSRNVIQQAHPQQINVFTRPRQNTIQQTQNPVIAIKSEPVIVEPVNPVNQPYILPEQIQIPSGIKVEPNPPVSTLNITKSTSHEPLQRPASLTLTSNLRLSVVQQQEQHINKLSEHGISIDTPSSIIPCLNFDTLTSTGLTPTATPVSGFHFPVTSTSTPGTLNTPMTSTASIGSRCSTQQRSCEVATGSVPDINSPEGISLVSL
jgi:hypothetical protein